MKLRRKETCCYLRLARRKTAVAVAVVIMTNFYYLTYANYNYYILYVIACGDNPN